jgi:4-alpha-glucanotransferase
MELNRSSGILLHPTSLPGPYGIGDVGPAAFEWIDFLYSAGCSLWQVLPLGPTGYGDSPYQAFSAFAGNPYLVSPDALLADGLLTEDDLADRPASGDGRVDYGAVIPWKVELLERAYRRFRSEGRPELHQEFQTFEAAQAGWLPDFALFMALKELHGGRPWSTWEAPLRSRQAEALERFHDKNREKIETHAFRQFLFFRQWARVRDYAHRKGISIIGDAPIFVAHDSADVWAHPELFFLDDKGRPVVVAGVPPDYFSPTGQLWGNPLYNWDVHRQTGYEWWINRLRAVLSTVDILRLDHFRGFAAYWEVRGRAKTAKNGRWVPGPGKGFFTAMQAALGDLPIIAEDLGVITQDVIDLRQTFGLPGMKVILFGFLNVPKDPFLPHNYERHFVAYTGTHDNDTARGWYERAPEWEKDLYRRYLSRSGDNVSWDLIRAVWWSVAAYALAPMQDFLSLGNEARMNHPGTSSGNWTWRMPAQDMHEDLRRGIREINFLYGRENPVAMQDAEAQAREAETAARLKAVMRKGLPDTAFD